MGIFFDQDWFDGRLEQAGLTRASMARAAGMTGDEIGMGFPDPRELEGTEKHATAPRRAPGKAGWCRDTGVGAETDAGAG